MKSELEKDGFRLISSRATAKYLKTYKDEKGRMRIKDQLVVGKPSYVKNMGAPVHDGESVQCETAHTFNVYEREKKVETTSGVVKEREIVEEQYAGLNGKGNSDEDEDFEQSTEDEQKSENPNDLPAWGKVLKNMVDNLSNNQTAMWIVIVALALLCGVCLVSILVG